MPIFTGTAGNDSLIGTSGDDTLSGFGGDDSLRGNGGNDILDGGDGNDFLNGGNGDDFIDGGAGFDRAAYYQGNPALGGITVSLLLQGSAQYVGSQGWDTLVNIENISGTPFADTITGDAGDNWLWGSSSWLGAVQSTTNNDTIDGGAGNDLIEVGYGNHILTGGSGTDTLLYSENGGAEVPLIVSLALQGGAQNTGAGSWTLSGFENLAGGTNNDQLTGDANANILAGGDGNDLLVGGGGNDSLYGDGYYGVTGSGSGSYFLGTDADVANGAVGGNDTLEGGLGDDLINGGIGIDTASYANALGGVTAILYRLGTGNGEASGADGNDILVGIENLTGSAFDDALIGNDLDNVLTGGDGNDGLRGRGGNDTLLAGNGNDFLNGGLGNDIINGGAGYDRAAFYTDATAGVTVDLNLQGVAQDTSQGMDTLIGIENLSGTGFGDTLTGDGGDNWLWGSASTLTDGTIVTTNNDTLDGGGGNDLLTVGIGNHSLTGGSGTDTVAFTENGAPETAITVSLLLQGAAQATGNGSWTLTGIENLSGGTANDMLTGDGNANVLAGDQGNDVLSGGAGNDILYGDGRIGIDFQGGGGSGPITTYADVTMIDPALIDGNDTLEGGLGDDVINGGGGIDTASYANASGSVTVSLFATGNGNGLSSGADGNDTLVGIENITGSAYNDLLFGNNLDNVLTGGDGTDFLRGRAGNDTLIAGNGDDYLDGGLGDDILNGGAGYDRVSYFGSATGPVTIDLRLQGTPQNTGQGMDTLIGIEHFGGTTFGDTLIGDEGDNWIRGSTDGGAADTIDGQGGNDLIEDGAGNHVLEGGAGIDTFLYQPTTTAVGINVSLALQGAAQDTGVGLMTLTGFENLSGSQYADTLIGDGNANVLAGGDGNDTLIGGAGNDTLYGDGNIGVDTHGTFLSGPITTFIDADVANGAVGGNDTLEGGLGNDVINGGIGVDTASYANASGSVSVTLTAGGGSSSGADGNDTLISIENVTGSAFDDSLTGNNAANALTGGDGNDGLRGRGGDDILLGGNGSDFLNGGLGNDTIDGGAGFDRAAFYTDATAGVTVDLNFQGVAQDTGQGMDTLIGIEALSGTAYGDTLIGDNGDNWLWGSVAVFADGSISNLNNDTLIGNGGNDLLMVGVGNHSLSGGTGIDTVSFSQNGGTEGAATISLALQGAAQVTGNGSWTLTGIENLSGGYGNDTLTGDGGDNVLAGAAGDDTLIGGAGNDTLLGDGSIGLLNNSGGSGGIATFTDALPGTIAGNDTLEGGLGNDVINGGIGVDTASYANASGSVSVSLTATGGSSSGADGNDTLISIENVLGSAYNDSIVGNADANVLVGGAGHDILRGNDGDDSLSGGTGDDFLNGGAGNDVLDGGAGIDRVAYAVGATAGVTVDLNIQGVAQNTGGAGLDTLIGIEQVSGTIFNDVLTGNSGDNWLWGGSNGSGVTGNDTISGGAGNDLIEVGAGTHLLNGGTGIDTLSLWGNSTDISAAGVNFSLALQGAAQNTLQGMMNASGFENVSGSRYNDVITGDAGANTLVGDTGNDTLNGGDGNDILYGDGRIIVDSHGVGTAGAITLYGDVERDIDSATGLDGNDILNGGKGDDFIYGGRGNDIMSGGPGADRFIIEAHSGADRITDFAHIDRIVFDAFAGPHAFSDLVLTAVGKDVMISWGTGDSLVVEGYRPRDLTAADFTFSPAAAASQALSVTSATPDGAYHGYEMAGGYTGVDMGGHSLIFG